VAQAPQPAQPALARLAADVQLSRAAALTPPAPAVQPEQKTPTFECASCHWDAHLGQVGASCDRCHAVEGAKFKAVRFSHDKAEFPLTGKHEPLECAKCHTTAVRAFPAATGSAVQYHPLAKDCVSCHKDPHLGQVGAQCETCHATAAFAVENYKHQGLRQFFAGSHGKLECIACHKKETGQFPAGQGTAIRFRVGTTCEACHKQF
jgi:nitrate/TMAO reductase-like tetraheme cytochrome c subunit